MSISRNEMIKLDKEATSKYKIPSLLLMENAAVAIFHQLNIYDSYTIVCGGGNNGGDGVALARHLLINKKDVDVFIVKDPKSDDLIKNLEMLKNLTENIFFIENENDLDLLVNSLEVNEVCVDAIFGTGLTRNVDGIYEKVIDNINAHSNYTCSIDIPSGLDADTGNILGSVVMANETITIHDVKDGMVNNEICGKISTVYIGIPAI
ncbi:NAD(P)H-hydrate epimerase [Peptoniphilus sp. oral taxon 386]|uniref:NAD(P)H-hydrate epimerase n=1 Tax=Peptoniphilus sp. oral taxon 386 TaxID=652713 RepID=UPI0001DAA0DA|nr:NAD(P)H-hydrate epimerase [Peptoniphilus sp. oral taxon 386]EFI41665.1 YjeF-like protein [Peptoniphilus sp. oral taxon 386 str. F0131]